MTKPNHIFLNFYLQNQIFPHLSKTIKPSFKYSAIKNFFTWTLIKNSRVLLLLIKFRQSYFIGKDPSTNQKPSRVTLRWRSAWTWARNLNVGASTYCRCEQPVKANIQNDKVFKLRQETSKQKEKVWPNGVRFYQRFLSS